MRILLVEDDPTTARGIEMMLTHASYNVFVTDMGEEGIDLARLYDYDLILLDLDLPDMHGMEVLRQIRMSRVDTPILILTGSDDTESKLRGFGFGADDYMTKPYNPRELVARVKAVLRRGNMMSAAPADQAPLHAGALTVDPARREAYLAGQQLDLRTKEFDLLQVFVENQGLALRRNKLLDLAWGFDFYGETRTVDVHVAHLRERLKGSDTVTIETVWGVGYKLVCTP